MEQEILYRFFEGDCTKEEIRKIRTWVDSSSENKKEFFREGRMYDAIELLVAEDKLPVPALSVKKSRWADLVKIAAAVAIVLSIAGLWNYSIRGTGHKAMTVLNVPAGKNVNVILPDGSVVWLNARTRMEYPSSFEKGKREIKLDGEAYFEVAYDKKRPFTVHTKEYDVEVLGTKFNIQAYSFLEKATTSLMEGAVKLSLPAEKSQAFMLRPNQMAYFENGKFVAQSIKDYNPYRWKEGLICFDNISFPEIMLEFERYYEVKIHIENENVKDYLCTGKFRQSDGVDYALRILQKDVTFRYERVENSPVIYIK
jgi:ferric-dicitrate binding protein FerR (iron transport regulator)